MVAGNGLIVVAVVVMTAIDDAVVVFIDIGVVVDIGVFLGLLCSMMLMLLMIHFRRTSQSQPKNLYHYHHHSIPSPRHTTLPIQ